MWESTVKGRKLSFHLAGINNQNFIMQDEETGSWWQQVSGQCFLGPLKGEQLQGVYHEELTFATWAREHPQGRVLRPDEGNAAAQKFPANWEEQVGNYPVTTHLKPDERLPPRELIIGIKINGAAKAYPFAALEKQSPLIDTLGGVPLVIVLAEDQKSVRAFETALDGRHLQLFRKTNVDPATPLLLIDAETGSEWDFTGTCLRGELAGRQLKKIPTLKDYWFDWWIYNQQTAVYRLGAS